MIRRVSNAFILKYQGDAWDEDDSPLFIEEVLPFDEEFMFASDSDEKARVARDLAHHVWEALGLYFDGHHVKRPDIKLVRGHKLPRLEEEESVDE